MRTRPSARRIAPSSTCEHARLIAASALRSPRNWKLDVRPTTASLAPRASRWMISSLTPSEKYCISASLDRLSKGSTARMVSPGVRGTAAAAGPVSAIAGDFDRLRISRRRSADPRGESTTPPSATSAAVPLKNASFSVIQWPMSLMLGMSEPPNLAPDEVTRVDLRTPKRTGTADTAQG